MRLLLAFCALMMLDVSGMAQRAAASAELGGRSRILWRFRIDSMYSAVRPVIGAKGTIYTVDVGGILYAINPDGTLRWKRSGAGNKGIALGQDGTIYVASENDIAAYDPTGAVKWRFALNPRAMITLGVGVGPDGNIYAVATESIGVFSLTPAGDLRWSTPERYNRPPVDYGEIVFGANGGEFQLYFYQNGRIRAVRLSDGATVFPNGQIVQPFGQPSVSPLDQTVHANVLAYDPNGNLLWKLFNIYPGSSGFPTADVGNDGIHYVIYPARRLYAVYPNGAIKYQRDFEESLHTPSVSPDNTTLVVGTNVLGGPNSILIFNAEDGSERWREPLPNENGDVLFIFTRPRFTPDSTTAYVYAATSNGVAYLYAVNSGAKKARR